VNGKKKLNSSMLSHFLIYFLEIKTNANGCVVGDLSIDVMITSLCYLSL
jgi:hypothetical protein